MSFEGVIPAITTPFRDDLSIDHEFLKRHAAQIRATTSGGASSMTRCSTSWWPRRSG